MRRSSRRIPLALPQQDTGSWQSAAGWIAAVFVLAEACVVLVQHPVAVGAVALVLVVIGMRATKREKARLKELLRNRSGESICEFARSFDAREIDPLVIRSVYEQLQDVLSGYCPALPIRASDRLTEDLGIDVDDLDMSVAPAVASRSGRSLEGVETNPYYGRVKTASDLVYFFNLQREGAPVV